ncbi:MAG TPA: MFS transporter [Baekduia sp.]|uniref:MFS transporter n=1 Tax=Baekduia sp. TaxID=2600305 RepID=UPI002BA3CA2D|nr:MFS transporter [Baekduia sp.]HMJ35045.1 MFS transporter [Baekduia sp.]
MQAKTEIRPGETPVHADANRTLAVTAAGTLLVLAVFMAAVTTARQSSHSLHGGLSGQTWILSGMSLGLAAALLTVGALADELGRRRILVLSSALLALTSALGAVAPNVDVLVAARILQGAAGAGVLSAALGAIGHAFPTGRHRIRATSVWASAVGAGITIGPLAGGALAVSLGWRSSYWVQALAAAALVPAAAGLPESRAAARRSLDLSGAVTLAVAMACLTAGLVDCRHSWSAAGTIIPLAVGAILLPAFAGIELRKREPMLELSRFSQPLFVASVTGALFTGLGVIGLMSFAPVLLQNGLHINVIGSAGVLAAWSATSTAIALATRPLVGRLSAPSVLALGFAISAAGEFALAGLGVDSPWTRLLPGLAVLGIGSGLVNASLGRLAVESVPRERAGMGSGANNTARYLGGAAGVALVVALATSRRTASAAGLLTGWNTAAIVCGALCLLAALLAAVLQTR